MPEESEIGEVGVDKLGDEATEHARARSHTNPWMRWLGLSTALFAVIAAIASLRAGHFADEALLRASEATLKQSEASDQWAFYQAKGNKGATRLSEAEILAAVHAPDESVTRARDEAAKFKREQDEIQVEAKKLQDERRKLEEQSREDLRHHQSFAYAVTTLQVAIGLSAVAALIARRGVWLFALAVGIAGVALFAASFATTI
jgi:hypothetical protein